MPVMPRLRGKATKIAWSILGKPLAMQKPRTSERERKIDKQLIFEETTRVR